MDTAKHAGSAELEIPRTHFLITYYFHNDCKLRRFLGYSTMNYPGIRLEGLSKTTKT
jgi:hypothetical protein